jgi:hypothetical protein
VLTGIAQRLRPGRVPAGSLSGTAAGKSVGAVGTGAAQLTHSH